MKTLLYGAYASLSGHLRGPKLPDIEVAACMLSGPAAAQELRGRWNVLDAPDDLGRVIDELHIELVLVALPIASLSEMLRVLEACASARIACKAVADDRKSVRDLRVEDLLGRLPAQIERNCTNLSGQVVLVTGAAGSIGSELCRQIAACDPSSLIALDCAETALFELDCAMRAGFPALSFTPLLANIRRQEQMKEAMARYRPAVVFHAAAYKHVPLMEDHLFEAVENNVLGTLRVAESARDAGVREFVLVSSDKAVRPTSVMGATKRAAERLLCAMADGPARFISVRFGNVLGSAGSVVPILRAQIAAGGPVTITHPDMSRYFMTAQEACQLVLQAAAVGESGQICVLEMGQPVRILDLARALMLLRGLAPGKDIEIRYSGIRPGEKLAEELTAPSEESAATGPEKIRVYSGERAARAEMEQCIAALAKACEARDGKRVLEILLDVVPDYTPSAHLLRKIACEQGSNRVV